MTTAAVIPGPLQAKIGDESVGAVFKVSSSVCVAADTTSWGVVCTDASSLMSNISLV